jgi:two-component system sensor histidine kinase DesK
MRAVSYAAGPARQAPEAIPAGLPGGDDEAAETERSDLTRYRRLILIAMIAFSLITPAIALIRQHASTGEAAFLLPGSLIFLMLTWRALVRPPGVTGPVPWGWLGATLALAIALYAVGAMNWFVVLAVAAAACGRYTATPRPAIAGAVICGAAGLVTAVVEHASYGNALTVALLPGMAAFFSYAAGRRNEMVATLRRTRAELAMVAVGEERLRIGRDLHDLLGHSLSLITLKAELVGRLIETDTGRAAQEIAELESVARRSLSEVRGAVTGYRQPDLHAELAAARQLLTTAGIACRITAPETLDLPPRADALLAWTVREAVTNLVRHSAADRASVTVRTGPDGSSVEVTDDGTGPGGGNGQAACPAPGPGGTGLAGLAERVSETGGTLTAGPARPRGFRLAVSIPACPAAAGPAGARAIAGEAPS